MVADMRIECGRHSDRDSLLLCVPVILFIAVSICAIHALAASSDNDVVEATKHGRINWSSGWIEAVGTGYGPANAPSSLGRTLGERAGYAIALRNLLEVTKGVRVDSESFVKSHMDENQTIKAKVSGLIQGAQITRSSVKEDGGTEVLVRAPLWGIDSGSLISTLHKPGASIPGTTAPSSPNVPILVDARGLGATPALLPSIVNEQGNEVYSASQVDPQVVGKRGAGKYFALSKDIDLRSHFNMSPQGYVIRPVRYRKAGLPWDSKVSLSVRGIKASGTMRSTLVISAEDSARLTQDPEAERALRQGNVIFVIDSQSTNLNNAPAVPP